jgi:hypothetical protein
MTIVQFVDTLRSYGVDVLVLGVVDCLLYALFKRVAAKYFPALPKRVLTLVPFVLGVVLYAAYYFLLWAIDPSTLELIVGKGFAVGCVATIYRAFFDKVAKQAEGQSPAEGDSSGSSDGSDGSGGSDSGEKAVVAVVAQLLSDCLEEPTRSLAAGEIVATFGSGNAENADLGGSGESECAGANASEINGILKKYLPNYSSLEISVLEKLISAVLKNYKQL